MENKVLIFDTTLRDGEQSAGIGMTGDEKMEIARQLQKMKVRWNHSKNFQIADFKTALEVLTTGKASWMPDVSIPPCSQDRSMLTNLAELHPTPTIDRYRSFGIPREAQHSAFYTT
mgnify:CR=1 FL=1